MAKFRIAIIESPNPIDAFVGRSEAPALAESSKLFGHQVVSYFVRSRREFQETVKYLSATDSVHATDREKSLPLILHISCHGNDGCVAMGSDDVDWEDLVDDIKPLISNKEYAGELALSISSCGSGENTISDILSKIKTPSSKSGKKFPKYIFSIDSEEVGWKDALIAWSLLYLKLSRIGISNKKEVISALKQVCLGTDVVFRYSRFDTNGIYKHWSAGS
jgi:hypothetical protein